jgi:hypothetical protein
MIFIFVVIVIAYSLLPNNDTESDRITSTHIAGAPGLASVQSQEKQHLAVVQECEITPLSQGAGDINAALGTEFDVRRAKATYSLNELLIKAKLGDSPAAIALLASLRSCSLSGQFLDLLHFPFLPSTPSECAKIPREFQSNPLLILIPAAESGSINAKLLYLKNAPIIAEVLKESRVKSNQSSDELVTAERYGREAAQAGSIDAYEIMAYNYHTGVFGHVDIVRSYAYTLGASQVANANSKERLNFLQSRMTFDQLNRAQRLAAPCGSGNGMENSIINPFL